MEDTKVKIKSVTCPCGRKIDYIASSTIHLCSNDDERVNEHKEYLIERIKKELPKRYDFNGDEYLASMYDAGREQMANKIMLMIEEEF